nr:unnamed protein product [Callosobruchus chinensis]
MSIFLTAVALSYQSRVLLNFASDRQPQKLMLIKYLLGFFCLWQNHHYQRHGLATVALQANYMVESITLLFELLFDFLLGS